MKKKIDVNKLLERLDELKIYKRDWHRDDNLVDKDDVINLIHGLRGREYCVLVRTPKTYHEYHYHEYCAFLVDANTKKEAVDLVRKYGEYRDEYGELYRCGRRYTTGSYMVTLEVTDDPEWISRAERLRT